MPFLSGEFECKLDPKSRMMLPSGFKKKLPEIESEGFVINRGSGPRKFLQLYTAKDWEKKLEVLDKLNQYDEDNITVIRYFMNGATEFMPDALGRIVLPKFLREHAGIESDIIIVLLVNRIEIWSAEEYAEMRRNDSGNMSAKISKVLGGNAGRVSND